MDGFEQGLTSLVGGIADGVTGVVSQYNSGQETKYPLLSLPYSHPFIILDSPGLAQSFSAEKYK